MANILLDFIFPRKCLGCGKTGAYFCSSCLNLVLLKDEPICPTCGRFAVGGITHPGCLKAFGLDGLTSIFSYKGILQKAIKKLKYRFVTDIASDLTELFLSFCGENKAFVKFCQEKPVLIPIPLHPKRQKWRGFNQSELLGQMIGQNLDLDFQPDLLRRITETKPQAELNKEARIKNIKGVFKINPSFKFQVISSKFVIFDDIWTSGATLREASKVLKRSGAEKVWGLTIAR